MIKKIRYLFLDLFKNKNALIWPVPETAAYPNIILILKNVKKLLLKKITSVLKAVLLPCLSCLQ